jgi:broad specificity phosphatase PhoE
MSRLILVRHAQASFFSDNYDRLSPLGERQARALGEHWVRLGVGLDEVIVGPRERQIATERIVRSVYQEQGKSMPSAEIRPEFDEHVVDQLLGEPLDALLQHHPEIRSLAHDYRNSETPERIQRNFQRVFEAICHLWTAEKPGTESIEPWKVFQARVEAGLRQLLEHSGSNRTVAVFTSVGNITVALGMVLRLLPSQALELGWRLKNCSATELIFSRNRVTLDQFNSLSHLPDPATWSFR